MSGKAEWYVIRRGWNAANQSGARLEQWWIDEQKRIACECGETTGRED